MVELLRTKLFIPRPRSNLVSRPRLTERLTAGLDRKLTLIAAPAGFGKTTLLGEWIPQSPRCVTWLSLDESENDPTQFWTYFISSLQELRPNLGESSLALLQSPQAPPIASILTGLINDLSAFPDPFASVLDDYHVIDAQPIHTALIFLIEHLPANMNLVLTTRVDPPLPLARLRARDQLTELRANDLRFTADETAAFLGRVMGLSLSAEEIAALEARTEGWIAGLQIAALSMQAHDDVSGFIQAFSGSHRHILGYLADEVLNQQPQETLNFLLQTSILDRLCGPLCDAITGESSGQRVLESLEHANLFLAPLDDEGRWYRYHHLFAEVLQARLRQAQPGRMPELHRRARIWLEGNGLLHESVDHAIAGRDFEHAARLIEHQLSAKWLAGEINTLQGWLADLPVAAWRAYPRLWLVKAWVAMTVGDFVDGDANLKASEEALAMLDEETARNLRSEVAAFRASYFSLMQDPRAVELAKQALRELPADYWMRGMLVVFLGAAYYSAGDLKSALDALAQAPGSSPSAPGNQTHQVHLMAFSGTVHYAMGRLRDALALLQRSVQLAEPGGIPIPFVGTLLAYMSLSPVLYELGELGQARIYLTRCLEMAVNFGSAEVQVYVLSQLACICLASGDRPGATRYYQQIDALLQAQIFSPSIMANIDYRRFLLHLKQGNLAAMAKWVDAHASQDVPLNAYAFHRLALPQWMIAQGDYARASEILMALVDEAEETGHGALLVKALVLQALALHAGGSQADALCKLENALSWAAQEGFVRSFVDEGEPMRWLLLDYRSNLKNKIKDRVDEQPIRLLAYTEKLLVAFSSPSDSEKPERENLPEPLSERELEILRLIGKGCSNQEIAAILVIAVSTVKSHINNLYGKLGTNRRTQAILFAQERGLLSE